MAVLFGWAPWLQLAMETPWKIIVGSMQVHTTGTSVADGSMVAVEAMVSEGMNYAWSDLIVTLRSVVPKSLRVMKLML